ncbi:Gfo/Idh/MocA family protein [Paenibacillus xerothermodurans]|uniref:Gfo/Idh/MocA family oxidoreductase n=1 Tax=Paenibacillus xerothermodurans TaxID=1977292 RepID=A0A2W1NB71_PAEXE|nr:Gfo/Idh/MocA family oxidoreductase [Paenibacillus xerothermodurans]PZE21667.1 gfo/Idh/MocA family oxidoreductase [Paenibacillus xerothermodurans]
MRKVRVGIIGLGEVAQITHLPILESLSDRYEIAALCDISPQLLSQLGEKYTVERLYSDAFELTAQPDLDAVFVLNSDEYHAECAIRALQHNKHVLMEKPVCLTLEDADAIIQARDEAGVQVMVGYMRRFAPAFMQAVDEVKKLDKINYVRIRDIIGANRLIIDQASNVIRPSDIPAAALKEKQERAERMVRQAIGDVSAAHQSAYRLLCGLNSHDLSAMREIIGLPKRVIAASQWNGGRFINAILEFDGFNATFETGVDNQRRFDAHIQIYGDSKAVTVQYDTPYIRHLPTTIIIEETVGERFERSVGRPTFKDAYTVELEYFYDVVTKGLVPKTTVEDSQEDLKLIKMIIDALE